MSTRSYYNAIRSKGSHHTHRDPCRDSCNSPTLPNSVLCVRFRLGVDGTGDKFCQRATKQPISHRGSWGAQTGPGTFRRQLISIIMNYNQPWTTLGLAPQPQRENCDPNGSQGSANFHCIMYPGSPWSARRSPLRLQSAILTSTSRMLATSLGVRSTDDPCPARKPGRN